MRLLVLALLVFFVSTAAYATPDRKAAKAFVKQMEATVKAINKVLGTGDTMAIHNHSLRIRRMKAEAEKLFVPADPCYFAASSAHSLWTNQLLQFQRPSKMGEGFTKRNLEDYRDNLSVCKDSLRK